MSIYEKLMNIQSELKAPKNQYNNFGKYNYRNLEDILEGLKPLLIKNKAIINISDEVVMIGERYYIKATATIINAEQGSQEIKSIAYAREDDTKKGMDLSQLSGSTSSYARKYALNGLFAIDDTKDSDTTNTHGKAIEEPNIRTSKTPGSLSEGQIKRLYAIAKSVNVDATTVQSQIKTKFNKEVEQLTKTEYDTVCKGYEGLKK